jgi:SNF2 family DNA or RNA helicase
LAWFSQTHNREHYDQFNKRVLRQGNKNSHCTVHRFIMRHTVDEIAIAALRRKDKVQTALLDALKEYRLEKKTTKGKR